MYEATAATMARTKGKRSERDDVAQKLDRAIVGKARLIATHRGISVAELLSEMLKPHVDKAYAVMLRELEAGPR